MPSPSYIEALERSLGQVVCRARGELDLLKAQADAVVATANAKAAESEARLNALDAAIAARLATLTDGERGPQGERGPVGIDEIDVECKDDGETLLLKFLRGDVQEIYEVGLPRGLTGQTGEPGERGPAGDPGERGPEGPAGKMPVAKAWLAGVHYEGDVVTHGGQTWQALKDTGHEPGSSEWACIAERGADGRDAPGMVIRGTWTSENEYQALDVVALNGAAFVARTDNPGPCPGEGWQLMSAQGKRGPAGERGDKGDKGERGLPGASIERSVLDDATGLLTFDLTDGTSIHCDLAPLAERIIRLARAS